MHYKTKQCYNTIELLSNIISYDKINKNQRTNGPVNAHLISVPRISTKHSNLEKTRSRILLTFNTH